MTRMAPPDTDEYASLRRKLDLSEVRLAKLKNEVATAKDRAFHEGVYLPREEYAALQRALREEVALHQRLQRALGDVRSRSQRAREQQFEQRFVDAARALLDPATFGTLVKMALGTPPGDAASTTIEDRHVEARPGRT